ncbi:MAG: hypothetical protein U1E17_10860 [Geminicoccaceae bacterium]
MSIRPPRATSPARAPRIVVAPAAEPAPVPAAMPGFGLFGWQGSLAWCQLMLEGSLQAREMWRSFAGRLFEQQLAWLEELEIDCVGLYRALLGESDPEERLRLLRQHLEDGLGRSTARQMALLELLSEPWQVPPPAEPEPDQARDAA